MKFEVDMTVVTKNDEVLGFLEGILDFNNIPTEGEQNLLFEESWQDIPLEVSNNLKQLQVLENLILYDQDNNQDVIGKCLFSFFYIPSIEMKNMFISFFEEKYGFFFNDYYFND